MKRYSNRSCVLSRQSYQLPSTLGTQFMVTVPDSVYQAPVATGDKVGPVGAADAGDRIRKASATTGKIVSTELPLPDHAYLTLINLLGHLYGAREREDLLHVQKWFSGAS